VNFNLINQNYKLVWPVIPVIGNRIKKRFKRNWKYFQSAKKWTRFFAMEIKKSSIIIYLWLTACAVDKLFNTLWSTCLETKTKSTEIKCRKSNWMVYVCCMSKNKKFDKIKYVKWYIWRVETKIYYYSSYFNNVKSWLFNSPRLFL